MPVTQQNYYQDKEYVSNSMLRDFEWCAYYFQQKHIEGNVEEIERDYFVYGSALDALVTEGDAGFKKQFFVGSDIKDTPEDLKKKIEEIKAKEKEKKEKKPDATLNKTEQSQLDKAQERLKELKEREGKDRLTEGMYEKLEASQKEIARQKLFSFFMGDKFTFQEIITAEREDGVKVKGKLDIYNKEAKIIADIKTCADITRFDPSRYYRQLAWYRMLAQVRDDILCDGYLLVIDKHADFPRSEMFHIRADLLDFAQQENEELLKRYLEAKEWGLYVPVTEGNPDARRSHCFSCEHYKNCVHAVQEGFTTV